MFGNLLEPQAVGLPRKDAKAISAFNLQTRAVSPWASYGSHHRGSYRGDEAMMRQASPFLGPFP